MDTGITVSTESRPWRRKFSRRSYRDSTPRPFNHESGALTTELSSPLGPKRETVLAKTNAFNKQGDGGGGGGGGGGEECR